jgi:hypothetical protein
MESYVISKHDWIKGSSATAVSTSRKEVVRAAWKLFQQPS